MAAEVTIEMFGDVLFRRKIRKMAYRAIDVHPVMADIADDMQNIIEEQFATEGERGGHKWAELKFDTIARRGSAHPILVDSSDMLLEVTDPVHFHARHDGLKVDFPLGPTLQKAESAQYGFHVANQHGYAGVFVEPRRIVEFTDIDRRRFRDKIGDYVAHGDRSQ